MSQATPLDTAPVRTMSPSIKLTDVPTESTSPPDTYQDLAVDEVFALWMQTGTLPSGYAFSISADSNSTMSGIPGPGRMVGELLWSAGRRLEPVMDRMAWRLVEAFSYGFETPKGSKLLFNRSHVSTIKKSWALHADRISNRLHRDDLGYFFGVGLLIILINEPMIAKRCVLYSTSRVM
jgi:hypothetical protein